MGAARVAFQVDIKDKCMITRELLHPKELNRDEWRQLQAISREAFGGQLDRSQAEIDHFVAWHDPESFYNSHVDPNANVGTRLNPNQSFSSPKVAVATHGDELIGFGYAANNVSGSTRAQRLVKMMGTQKKYLWLSTVAVHPEYQRYAIATNLSRMLLMSGSPFQPVSAYIWPDEIRFMPDLLRRLAFVPTGEQSVAVFGDEAERVRQVRMQAPSTYAVLKQLNQ